MSIPGSVPKPAWDRIYALSGFHTKRTLHEEGVEYKFVDVTATNLCSRAVLSVIGCVPVIGVCSPLFIMYNSPEADGKNGPVAVFLVIRLILTFFGGGVLFFIFDIMVTIHRFCCPCLKPSVKDEDNTDKSNAV
jgi:hypothetical protein